MAATIPQGKTHTRYARLLVGGVNLSGDMRSIGRMGAEYTVDDITGWQLTREFLPGLPTVSVNDVAVMFNNNPTGIGPVEAGSYPTLSPMSDQLVSAYFGIGGVPSIGVPAFSAALLTSMFQVSPSIGSIVEARAQFDGGSSIAQDGKVWGQALAVGTELSATGSQASVDNGASSANGWVAFLHIPQTAGAIGSNTWSFFIEHGTNDSTWATLTTFTANGSAITSERKTATGTVNRYVRFSYTRTAGTARPWVSFIRL